MTTSLRLTIATCLTINSMALLRAGEPVAPLPRANFGTAITSPVGVYGGYGIGGHASTVGESYARGAADVIRARGQAALLRAEALRSFEEARSRDLDNDAKELQTRHERMRMGVAQRNTEYDKLQARRSTFQALNDASENPTTSLGVAERKAASKVRLAKSLLIQGKTEPGVNWLVEVLNDYPQTKAASEAYAVLSQMNDTATASTN